MWRVCESENRNDDGDDDGVVCVWVFNLCGGLSEYRNIAVSKIKLHTESREPCSLPSKTRNKSRTPHPRNVSHILFEERAL